MADNITKKIIASESPEEFNIHQTQVPQTPKIQQSLTGFQEQLKKDITGAQASMQQAQSERGLKDVGQLKRFQAKGIRVGKQVVAAEAFARSMNIQQQAIQNLVSKSGLVNQAESAQVGAKINDRLNSIRLELAQRAIAFEKKMTEYSMEEVDKLRARKAFGQLTFGTVGAVIGGYFGGPAGAQGGGQAGQAAGSGAF